MIMTMIFFWFNYLNFFSTVIITFFNVLKIWGGRDFRKNEWNRGKEQRKKNHSRAGYLLNILQKLKSIIQKLQNQCLLHLYLQWTIVIKLLIDLFHSWTCLINPVIPTVLSGKESSGQFVYWNCLILRNVLS